jgi:hypothetical protein
MFRKTLSLIAALLTIGAVAALQTESKAQIKAYTVPGWVYSFGAFVQNGGVVQAQINAHDYGTFCTGYVGFATATGMIACYPKMMSESASGAWLYGSTYVNLGTRTAPNWVAGNMWTHVWRGVNSQTGKSGTWIQAEVWSIATPTSPSVTLWATAPFFADPPSVPEPEAALLITLPKQ